MLCTRAAFFNHPSTRIVASFGVFWTWISQSNEKFYLLITKVWISWDFKKRRMISQFMKRCELADSNLNDSKTGRSN
ncbi:hypothetical protein O9993_01835 [Vibrio lentus]|nr:hypothetical protein [Vibrio lentus]